MSEGNILLKLTVEKNRKIKEAIQQFLGHTPTPEERKQFNIMHSLGESIIYFKGSWVGTIRFDAVDDTFI
jgi:hypothetical protein